MAKIADVHDLKHEMLLLSRENVSVQPTIESMQESSAFDQIRYVSFSLYLRFRLCISSKMH